MPGITIFLSCFYFPLPSADLFLQPSRCGARTYTSTSLHFSSLSIMSWDVRTLARALSSADWLLSLSPCPIFVDDFREQRSLWPSDNNVLDQYILCACPGVFLLCVYRLLSHISLESLNAEPLIPLPKVCRATFLLYHPPSLPN